MSRIELQSFDLFNRIERIHHQPTAAPDNLQAKYILLHKVLEQACYELTTGVTLSFANLFSRLDYICKEKKMTPSDRYAIQTMRRNCNAAMGDRFQADMQEYLYDLRALVRFVSLGFEEDIPASILPEIPHSNRPYQGTRLSHIPYVRASVTSWNDTQIFAATDSETDPFIIINYAKGGYDGDLLYLKDLLSENLPLNLLDVRVDEENHYIPNLIVIHPDYLIDISSLAACFREYGHHPLNYFMNKIKPRANTAPILMGNLASQFLDDYINEQPQEPVSYPRTIKKFFAASALDFCTCSLPADFHAQAQAQMMNIRSFVHDVLPHNIRNFNKKNTLLEASFICEKLGLQGRVDMMQKDFQVLIEQKAGKRDEYHRRHKEDHFIQMMLYQGVLMYNFGQETANMQTFLLYSKYADGLLIEHFAENLFRESIKLRNYIVHNEMQLGDGAIGEIVDSLSTDLLNELQIGGKLWNDYQEPQLQTAINTLKRCTPLERAYFNCFFTFVSKEQILSKTGGSNDASHGFAGNWHIPLHEKLEAGNILTGLTIQEKQSSGPGKGYDLIELHIPAQDEDFLPNFRTGDMVILYAYKEEPDMRKQILMKGNILELQPDRMTLVLRNGQQNKDIIGGKEEVFAVEHDFSDTSANNGFRGLYAFLSAQADRKELLLGVRPPAQLEDVKLNGDYGRFNELILKEKQAKDYFLLVGPPGTGKTSCALRFMVEEALSKPDTSILLLSYTNRAVDEICAMLTDSGIADRTPFIRIGNELSCDKRFVPYLLKYSLDDCPKLTDIQQKMARTRIFVGTTTAINNRLNLFTLKYFQLAIIDEASQILEPDLIGILSARHQQHNAIDKFVLVGDYKQLPAIAQQSAEEAAVTDLLLRNIGLEDCRNSLFERLYKSSPDACRSILHKQGRMHPAIAEFPNQTFYYREKLESVPLPHQLEETPYEAGLTPQDTIDQLLLERRMVFIPAEAPDHLTCSDKTNPNEARIVATLLGHIYRLTESRFDPNRTVGVIVPYRNQIAMIRKEIARLQLPALQDISIDTVERYQGSQRDIIIYSFTIQNFSQLNFLTANTFQEGNFLIDRKLNVALTRARKQLLLTGNPHILGANITFYKLMEYIRLHNGYLETDAHSFCRGDFTLPSYRKNWEVTDGTYSLPAHFKQVFPELIAPPAQLEENEAYYREATAYGRSDFRTLPEEMSPSDFCQVYNYLYMRKQYAAAQALFTGSGNWLHDLIRKVSGRVVFCDLSCEAGASGLAFADVCRSLPHLDLTYTGIYPMQEIGETAEAFFRSPAYKHIQASWYPRLSAVPAAFWQAHAVLTELVIFNLSSLFDRISPREARDLALQINQLVHARPLNHYVLVYRDDAGPCMHNHSYTAFCNHLSAELKPLQPQMPLFGKIHCEPTEGVPVSQEFLYEIRTN
ncbi:DEAD/DEAH box helicase [Phocaeicola plebeius]|uniref:DEAD/DEAH box helicase n=1 Tax=Phocaeicola plebeius TaxID=310297 RepID=UPI0026EB1575|nr:AAA domain-containing protein [Phocaeicola plebeius]MCI6049853.1 DEAD/DEAH box helicase family protein [Phocaeicola plebeius]MDD6912444.1 AAA domain-containing protein [Phocaeicola plebeius]MDY5979540.1 AAA domain-containing protein [Phocaeicola plebeius]